MNILLTILYGLLHAFAVILAFVLAILKVVLRISLWILIVWFIAIPLIEFITPIEGLHDLIIQAIGQLDT